MSGLISDSDRKKRGVRAVLGSTQFAVFLGVLFAGLGPILWTVKGAISPTRELLTDPLRLYPAAADWSLLAEAWSRLRIGHFMLNTVVLAGGSWLAQIVVSVMGAYALSVLRPRYGKYVYGAILATLFLPGSVSLVALYLTVLDVGIANTTWAVWLPHAAHAFTVLLMKRFFDGIPRELFGAAQVDGAGAWRMFWYIVLPMSKPILAVTSLLTIMGAWKDFLWPMVAISDGEMHPISVALPRLAEFAEENMVIAGMFMALMPPVLVFIVFQKYIVRGVGFTGVKG
ncbi:carbohydrate ABC transporter permease [Nonomuraea spiralis]|uniref:Carbohydrate ABC transporter permease n=1 Tax=Nonomuraea spiralis TaxID=46182 RepID=A0ABV5IX65_9ACTN|nr:carbohydrate ABC transporter permease [Nonomuraea spiralis]GGT45681.1 sugar ABC transporter permease [Nonomuraea spiralis]